MMKPQKKDIHFSAEVESQTKRTSPISEKKKNMVLSLWVDTMFWYDFLNTFPVLTDTLQKHYTNTSQKK